MALERFVAVDVETANRSPMSVCALAAVRFERGREIDSFKSLVQTRGPIRFGRIHGLDARILAGAPAWPSVWQALLEFAGPDREFVAYRAEFDRGALLAMCAYHDMRVPPLRFTCAAEMVERHFARRLDLREAVQLLGLVFPGRHHDPLADARAAALIVARLQSGPAAHGA